MRSARTWALAGTALSGVDQGGYDNAFASHLLEAQVYKNLAAQAELTHGWLAVELVHGEANARDATYATGLGSLWTSYNTAIPAITGQTRSIPLIVSQQNSEPPVGSGENLSA